MPDPYFWWLVIALVIVGLITVARWLLNLIAWLTHRVLNQ